MKFVQYASLLVVAWAAGVQSQTSEEVVDCSVVRCAAPQPCAEGVDPVRDGCCVSCSVVVSDPYTYEYQYDETVPSAPVDETDPSTPVEPPTAEEDPESESESESESGDEEEEHEEEHDDKEKKGKGKSKGKGKHDHDHDHKGKGKGKGKKVKKPKCDKKSCQSKIDELPECGAPAAANVTERYDESSCCPTCKPARKHKGKGKAKCSTKAFKECLFSEQTPECDFGETPFYLADECCATCRRLERMQSWKKLAKCGFEPICQDGEKSAPVKSSSGKYNCKSCQKPKAHCSKGCNSKSVCSRKGEHEDPKCFKKRVLKVLWQAMDAEGANQTSTLSPEALRVVLMELVERYCDNRENAEECIAHKVTLLESLGVSIVPSTAPPTVAPPTVDTPPTTQGNATDTEAETPGTEPAGETEGAVSEPIAPSNEEPTEPAEEPETDGEIVIEIVVADDDDGSTPAARRLLSGGGSAGDLLKNALAENDDSTLKLNVISDDGAPVSSSSFTSGAVSAGGASVAAVFVTAAALLLVAM